MWHTPAVVILCQPWITYSNPMGGRRTGTLFNSLWTPSTKAHHHCFVSWVLSHLQLILDFSCGDQESNHSCRQSHGFGAVWKEMNVAPNLSARSKAGSQGFMKWESRYSYPASSQTPTGTIMRIQLWADPLNLIYSSTLTICTLGSSEWVQAAQGKKNTQIIKYKL